MTETLSLRKEGNVLSMIKGNSRKPKANILINSDRLNSCCYFVYPLVLELVLEVQASTIKLEKGGEKQLYIGKEVKQFIFRNHNH